MADVYLKGFKTKDDLKSMKSEHVSDCSTSFGYVYEHNIRSTMSEIGAELKRVLKANPNAIITVEVR